MSKHYQKFFFKSTAFLVLLAVPFYFLARKYDAGMAQLKKEKAHWVLNCKNTHYDLAFLGSSRVYNCLDAAIVDSVTGYHTINLGVGGAAYPELYLLFDQFLKNGNTTKLLLIQIDFWGLIPGEQAYSHPFSEEKYLHLIGDPVIDSVYPENSNLLKFPFRKYVPYFKYAEFNNIYPLDAMLGYAPYKLTPVGDSKWNGSNILDGKKNNFNLVTTKDNLKDFRFSRTSIASLENLILLAKNKGIQVSLFTTPTYKAFTRLVPLYESGKDTITRVVTKHNLTYFNHELDTICTDSTFFRDYTHLNRKGTDYFSISLANELKKR